MHINKNLIEWIWDFRMCRVFRVIYCDRFLSSLKIELSLAVHYHLRFTLISIDYLALLRPTFYWPCKSPKQIFNLPNPKLIPCIWFIPANSDRTTWYKAQVVWEAVRRPSSGTAARRDRSWCQPVGSYERSALEPWTWRELRVEPEASPVWTWSSYSFWININWTLKQMKKFG